MIRCWLFIWVLAVGVYLVGCSTPATRSQERMDAFTRLSSADQEMVLDGQIRKGMNGDAVYIALGRPSRVLKGDDEQGAFERWVYSRAVRSTRGGFAPRVVRDRHGRTFVTDVPVVVEDTYLVDAFEVTFRKGRVTAWRQM